MKIDCVHTEFSHELDVLKAYLDHLVEDEANYSLWRCGIAIDYEAAVVEFHQIGGADRLLYNRVPLAPITALSVLDAMRRLGIKLFGIPTAGGNCLWLCRPAA